MIELLAKINKCLLCYLFEKKAKLSSEKQLKKALAGFQKCLYQHTL